MLSKRYDKRLEFKLQSSGLLFFYVLFVHISSFVAIASLGMPLGLLLLSAIVIIMSAAYYISRYALLNTASAINVLVKHDRGWQLQTHAGQILDMQLLPGGFCHRYLSILHFTDEAGAVLSLPLCKDAMQPDDYRQLCVYLRQVAATDYALR